MVIYRIYFEDGRKIDIKTKMTIAEFLVTLNDERAFFAVENSFGGTEIVHKDKIVNIEEIDCYAI